MFKNVFLGAALVCSGLSFAQEAEEKSTESLDEVILIDSKFEIKRENSGKVVTKITAEELERSRGQTLAEIINRVSGIEINGIRSNDGQNLGYYVRGGRNREVVILVDGVQLNDASSIANDFDLRLLSLNQVESIEIVKGASSTLYGSGAATAVINISTKEPVGEKIGLQLQSVLGTNQTQNDQNYNIAQFDNAVGIGGRITNFDYQVNFSNRFSENMSAVGNEKEEEVFEENPFNKYNVYARFGYRFSNNLKFHLYGNFDKFNSSYDDAFMYTDADHRLISDQLRAGSHWIASYNNGSFIFSDSYTEMDRENQSSYPTRYDSKIYTFDAHNKYVIAKKFHTLLGINGTFSEFNSFSIPFEENTFQPAVTADVANFEIIDPYINLVYISDFGLNLNIGSRLNIHSSYGKNLVYNFNPSYTHSIEEGYIKLLASYSSAYITPSLYQLYDPTYGNTSLEPEESNTTEAGIEYKNDKLRISGIYFSRISTNFIDFITVDAKNYISEYQNISEEFQANGIEVELQWNVVPNLNFSGNYTFTHGAKRFSLRIPKHKINANIGYNLGRGTFTSLSYQFNDDRNDSFYNGATFENEMVVLESYGILDFYLSQEISNNLKAFVGINNITNEQYEEIYRFNTRGRNLRVGMVFNFM